MSKITKIVFYDSGRRVGKTSLAFNIIEKKEFMREWALSFAVTNKNNARQFIKRGMVYEYRGQKFDNKRFHKESGSDNIAEVTMAYHVSRRLNNYKVPIKYSFIGTIGQIIQDILNVSGAKAEFSVGSCASLGTISYALNNDAEMTARDALEGLIAVGIEVSYDNFTINAPTRWGADTGKVFKFSRDLCDVSVEDDEDEDTTTYTIDIANLQRLPGGSPGDEFVVGDTIGILDELYGNSVSDKRIICYEFHGDDPTQDVVTIGQFVSDIADTVKSMKVDIQVSQDTADQAQKAADDAQETADAAKAEADNSVQIGTSYNNVDITHEFGFRSVAGNGLMRILSNGTDGFVVQQYYSSSWVTMWQAHIIDGKVYCTAYNLEHTQKTEQGGDCGLATYTSTDGINWTQTGGQKPNGAFAASEISTIGSDIKGIIGTYTIGANTYTGLILYKGDQQIFRVRPNGTTGFVISDGEKDVLWVSEDYINLLFGNGSAVYADGNVTGLNYNQGGSIVSTECRSDGVHFLNSGNPDGKTGQIELSTPYGTTTFSLEDGRVLSAT